MLWVHIIEQIFIEFLAHARTMQDTREKQDIHYFFTVGDYNQDAGFVRLFSEFISGKEKYSRMASECSLDQPEVCKMKALSLI